MGRARAWVREGLTALVLSLFFGCSPVPQAVRTATMDQSSFASIRKRPGAYRGKPALLGGRIVRVVNLDGRTRIEIDRLPLDDEDRPRSDAKGEGHFLAEIPERVSPEAYPWGRVATVWGKFAGAADGEPLIAAKRVYLWPRRFGKEPLYSPGPYPEGMGAYGWDSGWSW